jgi:hypothetical protein
MAEPSGDEVMVLLVSGLLALASTISWMVNLFQPWRARRTIPRVLLVFVPVAAWVGLLVVLRALASADVRQDPFYLTFYLIMGAAWCGMVMWCLPLVGLSARDDIAEQDNRAAVPALIGAFLGVMACYAGANVGDGPGWWCVVWAGGIATIAWFIAAGVVGSYGRLIEQVTVERDDAAGVRLGSVLLGSGVLCGRGAAGDWSDALTTVSEFTAAWPVIPLIAVAVTAERVLRTSPDRPESSWAGTVLVVVLEILVVGLGLAAVGAPPDGYHPPGQGIER